MKDTLIDWLGTFWRVLVSPTPQTFLKEAKKADGKFASAVGWLVFYGVYLYILASIAITRAPLSVSALLTALLAFPLAVILLASTAHFICQRVFRRKAYLYDKMLYLTVAILLPIFFIAPLLSSVLPEEFFRILSFILLLYQVALLTIAIKAIVGIEYWQAFTVVFFSIIAGLLTAGVTALLIGATISPPGLVNSK